MFDFFGQIINPDPKVSARFKGTTEYYDKVTNCPPVTLVHGRVYQISVRERGFFGGYTIVRVYDIHGRYLTWVPYSVSYQRFWEIL